MTSWVKGKLVIILTKKGLTLVSLLLLLLSLCFYQFVEEKSAQFNDHSAIELSKETDSIFFFYREDCGDCQKIFTQVYLQHKLGKNIQFINTNNQVNRKLARQFKIRSVPTFVTKTSYYSGTNKKEINKLLEESQ